MWEWNCEAIVYIKYLIYDTACSSFVDICFWFWVINRHSVLQVVLIAVAPNIVPALSYFECMETQVEVQPMKYFYFYFFRLVKSSYGCTVFFHPFSLAYFHLAAPWNWFPPACLLPLWATHKPVRAKKESDGGALFLLRGGFHTPPSKEAFCAHPFFCFWTRTERICGLKQHRVLSGGVSRECDEEMGSLQPTESIHRQKNLFSALNGNTPWEARPLTCEKNSCVKEPSWEI